MARTLSGIVLGILVAGLVVAGFGYGFNELYRLPAGTDFATQESLLEYAAATPDAALACVLSAWALAGLLGGWVAAAVARAHRGAAALVIGALLTATAIVYGSLIPHPEWVTVVGVLLPIPFAVIAALLATPRTRAPVGLQDAVLSP